jgi:hypothetical protein
LEGGTNRRLEELQNDELRDLKSSQNIIRVRWVGLVARKEKRNSRFWWGNLKERDHRDHLGVDGTMILKGILKN